MIDTTQHTTQHGEPAVNTTLENSPATVDAIAAAGEVIAIENQFGSFEFTTSQIIELNGGLIGFPEYTRYGLSALPGSTGDFRLLQCLDAPELGFIVFPTTALNPLIKNEDMEDIQVEYGITTEALALLHVATIRQGSGMTLNIKAPIVVDAARQKAWQHILVSGGYQTQQPLAA